MTHDPASREPLFSGLPGSRALSGALAASPGAALALVELGVPAFVAAGIAARMIGDSAPWFVLGAVVAGIALRAVDLESCALFVPGGLYGSVKQAFGRTAVPLAASVLLLEYVALAALGASAAGHAVAALLSSLPQPDATASIAVDDIATTAAVILIGAVWWWMRQGRTLSTAVVVRATGAAAAALVLVAAWCGTRLLFRMEAIRLPPTPRVGDPRALFAIITAAASSLFVAGSADALGRAASDFPQPRVFHLRRVARWFDVYALLVIAGASFAYFSLVPPEERIAWADAPLARLVLFSDTTRWAAVPFLAALAAAAVVFLALSVHRSVANAQQLLVRLSEDGFLRPAIRALHPRYGTPSRLVGLIAMEQLVLVLASAGRLAWLARACGAAIACVAVAKVATLVRMRTMRPEPRAYRVGLNLRVGGREWPVGLATVGVAVAGAVVLLLVTGDAPTLSIAVLASAFTALLALAEKSVRDAPSTGASEAFELEPAPVIGCDRLSVRPGNILVAIRRPGVLAHLGTALRMAGDREVVVMTARLVGVDVSDERAFAVEPTDEERRLLRGAAMLAERHGRAIHFLIVPATNAFDAVAEAAVRLRSAEVYVGESETLAADDQARKLGEAWERTPKPEPLDVRLVIHHTSGRTAIYQLGAHAPSLSTNDVQLIHTLWLDAVKSVGPQVHHHDVVRAALKLMEEQLHDEGPPRDAVLDRIRQIARPAEELAAAVHQRDFARLRDMVRNRPASDLAAMFTDLSLEDQVVTFRVLPRKVAAGIFEYLSDEAQQSLLKAMAQEDVAALLNNMAPDDRTAFLEELPASATQQLLAMLTPQERAVAVTLLGYPDHSIGRLMTPDYIAVREQWTVQQVLDYVRAHGHDSETLNVIYVVDDHGTLIDDIRIRELLLTPPDRPISTLMDRRFVALNAADDQNQAVTIFRREDRSALPVTDSAGVLIGIVTIDDVLDVAEAAATREIQRIGGSEALDEPYMRIAFSRMIQKRAGWLTALFLGEMLTATAMGAFEHEIERAVVLALFVPLIISSGGNSGSQASTLVIRAIALGEVQLKDWWHVMRREVAAGLALGAILGSIGFLRITLWSAFSSLYGPHWLLVAITVALALVGVVLWGTLIGSLLPFILRRLGFDPAASSAPFVATLVDVTGLIIYFTVGIVVLRGTLL